VFFEGGELAAGAVMGVEEGEQLGSPLEEIAGAVEVAVEAPDIGGLAEPNAAADELGQFGGAGMIEEGDKFLGGGGEEGIEREAGDGFAVFFEEGMEASGLVFGLEADGAEIELDHALDFAKDVVLVEHGGMIATNGGLRSEE